MTNDNPYLNIKEADNFGSPYYYAERLGKDSVAFVLYNSTKFNSGQPDYLGFIKEFKPPIQEYLVTAFGGSLDKDLSKEKIVIEEVREEAGYEVSDNDLVHIGKYFVSSQMSQFCDLYIVQVTEDQFVGKEPENLSEEMAEVVWLDPSQDVFNLADWKGYVIVSKFFTKLEEMHHHQQPVEIIVPTPPPLVM